MPGVAVEAKTLTKGSRDEWVEKGTFELDLGGAVCTKSTVTVHKKQMQLMEQPQDMPIKGSQVRDKAEIKD